MTLSKSSLESAAEEGLLELHQVDPLYEYLRSVPADGPRFDFTHVLYYLGGLIAIGALGACIYFGYLANEVFRDSWLFPVALTLIGAAVIYLGVLWQKNEAAITLSVRQYLPLQIRELLEGRSI